MHSRTLAGARAFSLILAVLSPICAQVIRTEDAFAISFPRGGLGLDTTLQLAADTTGVPIRIHDGIVPSRLRIRLPVAASVPTTQVMGFWKQLLKQHGFLLVPIIDSEAYFVTPQVEPTPAPSRRPPPLIGEAELLRGLGKGEVLCEIEIEHAYGKAIEVFVKTILSAASESAFCSNFRHRIPMGVGTLAISADAGLLRRLVRCIRRYTDDQKQPTLPELMTLEPEWIPVHTIEPILQHMDRFRAPASAPRMQRLLFTAMNRIVILGTDDQVAAMRQIKSFYAELDTRVGDVVVTREFPLTFVAPHQLGNEILAFSRGPLCGRIRISTSIGNWSVAVTAPAETMPLVTDLIRERDQ